MCVSFGCKKQRQRVNLSNMKQIHERDLPVGAHCLVVADDGCFLLLVVAGRLFFFTHYQLAPRLAREHFDTSFCCLRVSVTQK